MGKMKHSYEFVHNYCYGVGINLLSPNYTNNTQKLKVECLKCGFQHPRWTPTFHDIKDSHSGCPQCAKKPYRTQKEVEEIFLNKNLQILEKYQRCHSSIKTKCLICENIFFPSLNNVISGTGCPKCNKNRKSQKKLLSIVKKILNKNLTFYFNCYAFDWLKNPKTGYKFELDVWIPELKLAIEYDGIQHFQPTTFGGMSKEKATRLFSETQNRDQIKNQLISEHSNEIKYFIRIPYTEELIEKNIRKILKNNNIKLEK